MPFDFVGLTNFIQYTFSDWNSVELSINKECHNVEIRVGDKIIQWDQSENDKPFQFMFSSFRSLRPQGWFFIFSSADQCQIDRRRRSRKAMPCRSGQPGQDLLWQYEAFNKLVFPQLPLFISLHPSISSRWWPYPLPRGVHGGIANWNSQLWDWGWRHRGGTDHTQTWSVFADLQPLCGASFVFSRIRLRFSVNFSSFLRCTYNKC